LTSVGEGGGRRERPKSGLTNSQHGSDKPEKVRKRLTGKMCKYREGVKGEKAQNREATVGHKKQPEEL